MRTLLQAEKARQLRKEGPRRAKTGAQMGACFFDGCLFAVSGVVVKGNQRRTTNFRGPNLETTPDVVVYNYN